MLSYLESLRKKPEHVKRRVLYITAPFLTLIVVILWFFSAKVGGNFSSTASELDSLKKVSPKEIFSQDVVNIFDGIKEKIKEDTGSFFTR